MPQKKQVLEQKKGHSYRSSPLQTLEDERLEPENNTSGREEIIFQNHHLVGG